MNLDQYKDLKNSIENAGGLLVAVSKTKPNEAIQSLYNAGQRIFGENRVQELVAKQEALPKDIQWHCIGHLQRNKVKYIAPFVALIHSIDSIELLKEVNKQAKKNNRTISILLQFHIAKEESKFGLNLKEAKVILESKFTFEHITFAGVMGMATFTSDEEQVKLEFQSLKAIFDSLKSDYFDTDSNFKEISMGMSGDYQLALAEGSTMVRIGSLLFGSR